MAHSTPERFPALSLADLLEAREAYHVHLLNQRHVVATAVGRYLARIDERSREPQTLKARLELTPGDRGPRTLENSEVHDWSWPCVLVFVDHWMTREEIGADPDQMVPRLLFLPSGKVVPTCVIFAPPAEEPAAAAEEHLSFPSGLLGPGYVCVSEVQGQTRVGSIACLVTDGDLTYALTNRHVAGEPGRVLSTVVRGSEVELGRTAARSVGRMPFGDVYPGLATTRAEVALDAALVELDDINTWTTQIFGVGQLEQLVDVSPESLTLDWIGKRVRAFGAASGDLSGEILALYYRYGSRSGVEYVADLLIGPPGEEPLMTRPGDSGTLWVLDEDGGSGDDPPPVTAVAMEWGGERLVRGPRRESPYALATFLSNVCRALDVDVVFDWNTGHKLYWGQAGHYTIGAKACEVVQEDDLRAFFLANRDNVSFELADIEQGKFHLPNGTTFYPLADVPDLVWKSRHGGARPHEKPNHFADMDEEVGGQSLLSKYRDDQASVNPAGWLAFYQSLGATPSNMGLLPFRVSQLYVVMVESLMTGGADATAKALCAAGTMAHYVGDACQPLHVSKFHDGRDDSEKGVHEAYETKMIDHHTGDIISGLARKLGRARPLPKISGQAAAAQAVAGLMNETFKRIPPEHICDVFKQTGGNVDQMWAALGQPTIDSIAAGIGTLAMLWSSAWAEANAAAPPPVAVDRTALRTLYEDETFAPSMYLTELAAKERRRGRWEA
jgi:hypothetical protein